MFNILYYDIYFEKKFGYVRIEILHTMSGMGSSLFSALFIPTSVSVGVSGAIMGLVGGTLSDLIMHPNKSIWTLIGAIIIRSGLVLIISQANNFGIIGGLITEILLGYVLLISRKHSRFAPCQQALRVNSSVLLTIRLMGGMVLFLKGVAMSDHCSWYHYLRCVPIKRNCKPNHVEI
ncbi:putative peptidase S54, rhomboid [Medicago truncatula]|uniref:RHOMBOID-like protein n=1 Tax=Medicago truncatula TaxID=3880 RepID=A0A396JFT8_MEDTR|nr:putative peptidase S54, rhomboid [Medicago truncatula]